MRLILSGILICLLSSASATNYYFSSVSGNDSRSVAQASNSATPWKSVNKLNSFFSSLKPGDAVLFKRGETFYGTIIITKSGGSGSPIVIGAYGSGARPVITALVNLSGWVKNSTYSGVYESSANSSMGSQVSMLLMNDVQKGIGRYPNITAPNKGYLTLESHSGSNSITDNELSSSPNWKGAEIVLRTNRWTIDRSTITDHSGKKLTYKNSTPSPGRDGYGYFIQNDIKTLDVLGEWYYNPSTKKMSVFFGTASPSSYTVKAATNDNLVYSSNISNVTIENLDLKGCNAESVNIIGGSNMLVQNCDISYSGSDGVFASGSKFRLENCNISNSNNDGVDVSKGSGAIVRNNTITNSYMIIGMGQSGNGQGGGIRNCSSGLVEYNQVINTGYVGIEMGGDYSIIRNNLIDNYCSVKDDGGGIYTSNGQNKTNVGRIIKSNIILNGIGAPDGTSAPNSSSADGIYFDDNANGVEITDNTVANCNAGIYLHNSRSIIVRNNTFYNANTCQLYMKHDALGEPLSNHTITNNIFFSKFITQLTSSVSSISNDLSKAGKLDSNYYARPIDDGTTIYSSYTNSSGSKIGGVYDLQGWKSLYNFDKASKVSAKQLAPYTITGTKGSNMFSDGNFTSNSLIKTVWANSGLVSWISSGMLDGGCLKVVPNALSSSIVINVGALSTSKKYVLRFSLKGTGNMSISAYLRAASYKPITDLKYWTVSTSRDENEMLFTPTSNEANGSVVFTVDAKQTYYLDNIEVYEATAALTNPEDSIKFVYNATNSNKTVSLGGNFVDVKNSKYSGSIVLKPYASAVLIQDGGSSATTNKAPTVNITSPSVNASFTGPADVKLVASASDPDGSISKVEFFNGSTLIQTENKAPYDWTWKGVPSGNYTITAKATDNSGKITTSAAVSFTVSGGNVSNNSAPTVNITSPIVNSTYAGPASVRLTASASDPDGTISKVEFYNGTTLIKTEKTNPYDWTWQNVPAGNYTITAKATDNSGKTTTSKAVSFAVASSNAPSVSITSPTANAIYNNASVRLTAAASDADGTISKVEFYNGNTLLTVENTAPYDWTWQNMHAGNYTVTAKATDNSGKVTTSSGVSFTVLSSGNITINNSAPSVNITSPVINANFNGPASVRLTASASDPNGKITKVDFYNGSTLITTEVNAPYDWTWQNVPSGNYSITAKATDNSGNVATSSKVTFTVTGISRPTVKITSPTINASYNSNSNVTLTAVASDADGTISKVEFYSGSTLITTEVNAPYSWTWKNIQSGKYTITAKATDNDGNVTTSAAVPISVGASQSLTIAANSNTSGADTDGTPVGGVAGATITDTTNAMAPGKTDNSVVSIDTVQSASVNKGSFGAEDFKLYPNPATSFINVKVTTAFHPNERVTLTITNSTGTLYKKLPVVLSGSNIQVDVSSLSPGLYILNLSNESFKVGKKFLKMKN